LVNRTATAQQATKELEAKILAAIATLEDAAAKWMVKSMDSTIAPELKAYYASEAKSAADEAARLRGEDLPSPGLKRLPGA
jgi:phospholipase/lecithinase/hemolysin